LFFGATEKRSVGVFVFRSVGGKRTQGGRGGGTSRRGDPGFVVVVIVAVGVYDEGDSFEESGVLS